MRQLFFFILLISKSFSFAQNCPLPKFDDEANLAIVAPRILVVTHASSKYDHASSSKVGIDATIGWAKENRVPVLYVHDGSDPETYFYNRCDSDYSIKSEKGHLAMNIHSNEVIATGGFLDLCLKYSVRTLIEARLKNSTTFENFLITVPMDATYLSYTTASPYSVSDFSEKIYETVLDLLNKYTTFEKEQFLIGIVTGTLIPSKIGFLSFAQEYGYEIVLNHKVIHRIIGNKGLIRFHFINNISQK